MVIMIPVAVGGFAGLDDGMMMIASCKSLDDDADYDDDDDDDGDGDGDPTDILMRAAEFPVMMVVILMVMIVVIRLIGVPSLTSTTESQALSHADNFT